MTAAARFVRQILLPEVGIRGQGRIGASCARVSGPGLASEIAVRYATAAGFGTVSDGALDVGALAPEDMVKTTCAREVLAGARATLLEIRRALQSAEGPVEASDA